jgi:hypothetical protein
MLNSFLLAANNEPINLVPKGQFANLGNITIASIVSGFILLVLIIAALVFFFMLVWGGIKYITSGGDKAQTETARNQITSALIGLVIVFAAWAIINLINIFFGIDIFSLNIPSAS